MYREGALDSTLWTVSASGEETSDVCGEGCGVKLLRVGPAGQERPVVMDDAGNLRDIGEPEIDGAFLASGGVARVREALERDALPVVDAEGLRIGAPIARPG